MKMLPSPDRKEPFEAMKEPRQSLGRIDFLVGLTIGGGAGRRETQDPIIPILVAPTGV